MRVTFVLPAISLAGGIRVLAIYADRLQRRGHKVTVVSVPHARPSLWSKLKVVASGHGWPKMPLADQSYFENLAVPHFVLESERPISERDVPDADVVLATFWRTAPWVAALPPCKGVKAILLQGYEVSPGRSDPAMDEAWKLPLRKILISKWLVDLAQDRFGDHDVFHVPNSVDTSQFYASPRNKQPIPTVGFLYATSHLKGVDVSLAALELLRTKLPNLRAIAFGAEHVSPVLPLPEWIEFHFRPPQDGIRQLYARCDVWLCGSRREGFHLPPLEAMACRCPVVSTRVGGPLDTIDNGVNGYLADGEDAAALADQLLKVLRLNEQKWRTMSDAALATATRYTWDDAADLLERALQACAAA